MELAKLFAAFPAQTQNDGATRLRMEAYFEAIGDLPAWAIAEARRRIIRGETLLDLRFAPSPPQLSVIARAVVTPYRMALADLERIQVAP